MFHTYRDEEAGIIHVVVEGRGTYRDFESSMPDVLDSLRSADFDKFLLEIRSVDAPSEYEDPNLSFSSYNAIKSLVSRMAVVCPGELQPHLEYEVSPVRNYGKPVKFFAELEPAVEWLRSGAPQ